MQASWRLDQRDASGPSRAPTKAARHWARGPAASLLQPPSCLPPARSCGAASAASAESPSAAAEEAHAGLHDVRRPCRCTADGWLSQPPPRGSSARLPSRLRVFFLDGHTGPANDMLAILRRLGVREEDVDGMFFGQVRTSKYYYPGSTT